MSIKHMDGFDQFEGQSDVAAALSSAGYEATGNTNIVVGRTAKTRCVQFEGSIKRSFTSNANLVVLGFAYCATAARSQILVIKDMLTLDWPGSIQIGGVTGEAKPIVGVWYYYEIVIDKNSHEIRVYINNELDLVASIPDSAMFIKDYEVTWASVDNGGAKNIDDLMFIDSDGGTYKDRVGPVSLSLRLPSADVVSEFSVPDENYHFSQVNKLPPVEGSYVKSNVSKAADTYVSSDEVGNGVPIAVGMVAVARKSDIDGRQLGMLVGDAKGTSKEVLNTDLTTTDKFFYAVFETDPNGSAWDTQSVQTTPFGIRVRP